MTISPSAVLITATSPTGLGLDFVSSLHAAKTRPNVKPNIPLRAIFNFMGWTFDTKLSQSHVRTVAWFRLSNLPMASDSSTDRRRFSLSPGERAGVEGKGIVCFSHVAE